MVIKSRITVYLDDPDLIDLNYLKSKSIDIGTLLRRHIHEKADEFRVYDQMYDQKRGTV